MESRGRRVHSIEKAIRLLDCFWEADSPLSLHELEQRTGWAKSTIHGLLATMLDSAVVEQNPTDGKYRLGYHLFELGSAVRQGWSVPELCRPHLRAMAAHLGESVHLARLSGDEFLLLFPHISPHIFAQRAEEIRASVEAIRLTDYPNLRLTVSLGGVYGACPIEPAIVQAETLLHDAKQTRNCCLLRQYTEEK